RLGISIGELQHLHGRNMIGQPCLAALRLAADPVAKYVSLVCVSLPLDGFVVHETSVIAAGRRSVAVNALRSQVERGSVRQASQKDSRAEGRAPRGTDRSYVIVRFCVGV